jgi:thiopeptide-type bacteriocin biosynthesis protein
VIRYTHYYYPDEYPDFSVTPESFFMFRASSLPLEIGWQTLANQKELPKEAEKILAQALGEKYLSGRWKSDKDLNEKALRYIVRSSSRAIPIGLLAGTGLGTIGSNNQILFDEWEKSSITVLSKKRILPTALKGRVYVNPVIAFTDNGGMYCLRPRHWAKDEPYGLQKLSEVPKVLKKIIQEWAYKNLKTSHCVSDLQKKLKLEKPHAEKIILGLIQNCILIPYSSETAVPERLSVKSIKATDVLDTNTHIVNLCFSPQVSEVRPPKADDVRQALILIQYLAELVQPRNEIIDKICRQWHNQIVPLLDLTLPPNGLGADIFNHGARPESAMFPKWLLEKYQRAVLKKEPIVIDKNDIQKNINLSTLARRTEGFSIQGEPDSTGRFFLYSISGTPGLQLMTRFTGSHSDLEPKLKSITGRLQKQALESNQLFAEVRTSVRDDNSGLQGPQDLWKYSIDIFPSQGFSKDNIRLDDLFVQVTATEIRLFSKRLKKEILPVKTDAYYLDSELNIIANVLNAISSQRIWGGIHWGWQFWPELDQVRYFPEVKVGQITINPESWRIFPSDGKANILNETLTYLQKQFGLPRFTTFATMSGDISFDLESVISRNILLDYLSLGQPVFLYRHPFPEENLIGKNKKGQPHRVEVIIPYQVKFESVAVKQDIPNFESWKSYVPGSDWIYFNVKLGTEAMDDLLLEMRQQILAFYKSKKLAYFFFVRMTEESGPELRLRFFSKSHTHRQLIYKWLYRFLTLSVEKRKIRSFSEETFFPDYQFFNKPDEIKAYFQLSTFDSIQCLKNLDANISSTLRYPGMTASESAKAVLLVQRWCRFFHVKGESAKTQSGFNWRRLPITTLRSQFDKIFRDQKEALANLIQIEIEGSDKTNIVKLTEFKSAEKLWTESCPLFQRMVHMSLNRLTLKVTHDHEKEILRQVLKIDTFLGRRDSAGKNNEKEIN